MRALKGLLAIVAAVAIIAVLQDGIHFLDEAQQMVVTRFGDPIRPTITAPGLQFDLPLVDSENYFDKRFLEYKSQPTLVPTRDKRYINVSAFAVWRVSDSLKFFQRVQNEASARGRLDEIVAGEVRNAVARYDLIELVRTTNRNASDVSVQSEEESLILERLQKGRAGLAAEVLGRVQGRAADLGFEILDVRFTEMNYVPDVQKAVFARMIAERRRVAEQYRAEGQGEAARIGGEQERDLAQIRSEAYRAAEQRRGVADGAATRIYADAYGRDPDFFGFVKSLDTYERSFDPNTVMILGADSELLKYLSRPK